MTAARHSQDANNEALRLRLAIQDLSARLAFGDAVTTEHLDDLLRKSACVQYHTARTMHAVTLFPAPERRAPPAPPIALGDIPTPLAALETLLAECELTLDYRPTFRHAMSDSHASIQQAKNPRLALHGSIELGESIDDTLDFEGLFDIPEPAPFNSQVLAAARGMAVTDGLMAAVREVAHV